jgi:hypothetical protein
MLHSGGDPVEVFLVQHAVQPGDNPTPQQPGADAYGMALDQQQQQQPFVQEAPSMCSVQTQQQQQQMQAQAQQAVAAAAAAAGHCGTDISMEPPGNLPSAAAAAAAAGGSHASESVATATRQPSSASPISLLAKAIGAGGVSASDIPVLPPAGAAAMVKQEAGSSHPAPVVQPVGLNSPVFPPPGSLSSPGIGACASTAQAGAKWNEIDPEAWFEGDGSALGALGDFFKNDSSIFQSTATDQHDNDLVTAW